MRASTGSKTKTYRSESYGKGVYLLLLLLGEYQAHTGAFQFAAMRDGEWRDLPACGGCR